MRTNIITSGAVGADGRFHLDNDWYQGGIPAGVHFGQEVYIDSSYGFAGFCSQLPVGMILGRGTGCYDRSSFQTGAQGFISIGAFNILNGTTFICNQQIKTGDHCMFAWGSVVTDSWLSAKWMGPDLQRSFLRSGAGHPQANVLSQDPRPVVIEDNVWVGFDTVILPGVTLGRGCIAASKSVVMDNIPPYAIVAGIPATIIRYLDPTDTDQRKAAYIKELG